MKHLVLSLLLATFAHAQSEAPWTPLFDGKSFAGWSQGDGKAPGAGWSVHDGMLHLNGTGGNLISEKTYSSFELEWEWKVAEGGNNGIKYWVQPLGEKKELLGIEYQMIDDQRHADALRGGSHTTACIYDIKQAATDKPVKPAGQWNISRIVVKNGKIEHWLNGKMVVDADTKAPEWAEMVGKSKFKNKEGFAAGQGHIMLTDHKDETWFKNIRLRQL